MANDKRSYIILSMALGLFMSALDNTIVSASINKVIDDIGGLDQVAWVFTAYLLASTSMMLIFGKLSDMFGRKKFYLIGIGFFLIGSALCGTATDIHQLIFYRVIQGIGAGAIFPISFSIIYTLFNDLRDAAKISGIFGSIYGLSSVAGPPLGTWISNTLGWRWCFYVNVPIGIVSFLVLTLSLQESKAERKPKIDFLGALLVVVSSVSAMLALELGGNDYAWDSWPILGMFALSAIAITAFIFVERRAAEPILPLSIFRSRMVSGTSFLIFCQGAIKASAILYLPLYAAYVLGKSNMNALLMPMMASIIVGAIAIGYLQFLFKFRTIMILNMGLGIIASLMLMNMSESTPYWQIIGIVILLGFGVIGPLMNVGQNAIVASVDAKYVGVSSSIVSYLRNIGGVMGASVMTVIVNRDLSSSIVQAIEKFKVPADQLKAAEDIEFVFRNPGNFSPELLHFYSRAMGQAINHGFLLFLCMMCAGAVVALFVGTTKYEMKEQAEELHAGQAA